MQYTPYAYPAVRRALTNYTAHNMTIPDPYQWLEVPDAEETKEFVTQQNAISEKLFAEVPFREKIHSGIKTMMDYGRTSTFSEKRGRYYYYHNTGVQNQSVLKVKTALDTPFEEDKVFFDPNLLSEDGTTAVASTAWSKSERYFAYSKSEKGSDWASIVVKDVDNDKDLSDTIEWVKFSGLQWVGDHGFFYSRYPVSKAAAADKGAEVDAAQDHTLYYHTLGKPQDDDVKVYTPADSKWQVFGEVTDDYKYVVVTVHKGCEPENLVFVAELPADNNMANLDLITLVPDWVAKYNHLGNDGTRFYFKTTHNAKNHRVIAMDIKTKEVTELVKESEHVLSSVALIRDTLILMYLEHVKDVAYVRKLDADDSTRTQLNLPIGTIAGFSCERDKDLFSVKVSSFTLPGRTFYFNINDIATQKVFASDVVEGLNADDFHTEQVFYDSDDGTKIPMFIVHRKGLELNGKNPTLLYGYGGFQISILPSFSPSRIVFLKHLGGVLAVANIRGGGEYGERWHNAGRRKNKQNCFTDFIAGAKYLHEKKYSSPESLVMVGGSNGGMLVAVCANQAPSVMAGVVAQVGVMDGLKFHKFTIGHAWTSDFGDPDVAEDFEVVLKYSPLHNVKTNTHYPAVLVTTGDHDDRVVPLHSLKYLATLQHANPEGGPFIGRIEVNAGHGAGKPISKTIAEAADIYCFICRITGAEWKDCP